MEKSNMKFDAQGRCNRLSGPFLLALFAPLTRRSNDWHLEVVWGKHCNLIQYLFENRKASEHRMYHGRYAMLWSALINLEVLVVTFV